MSTIVPYIIIKNIDSKITHQNGIQQIDVLKSELINEATKFLLNSNKDIDVNTFTFEIYIDILKNGAWTAMCYFNGWREFNIKYIDVFNKLLEVKEKGIEILDVKYNNYDDNIINKSITNDSGLVKVDNIYSIRIYSDKPQKYPYTDVYINQYIDVYKNNIKIIHSLFKVYGDSSESYGFTYIDSDNDIQMFKYFKQLNKINKDDYIDAIKVKYILEEEQADEDANGSWVLVDPDTPSIINEYDDNDNDDYEYEDKHYYNFDKNYYDDEEEKEYGANEDSNIIIGLILNKIQQKLYMYEWCDDVVLYFKLCLNEDIFISETLKPIKPVKYGYQKLAKSKKLEKSEYDKFKEVVRPKLWQYK